METMEHLTSLYFGNSIQQWAIALAVTAGCFIALLAVKRFLARRLHAFAASTSTQIDDLVVELVRRTRPHMLLLLAMYPASFVLTVPDDTQAIIGTIARVLVLLQLGIWGSGAISHFFGRSLERAGVGPGASVQFSAITFIGKLVLWSVIVLLALDNLGIDVTALITGLGIGGVAVALAMQSILGDLFASLSITLDKPFDVGDTINVDTMTGTVENIGLKTTRVRSLSGEQIILSNSDLLKSRIRNFKRMEERRVLLSISVTYQTPPESLELIPRIIREIVEGQATTRFDRSHFQGFGESALLFESVYFITNPEYATFMDIQQRVNLEIVRRFAAQGIEFAYPTRTVFVQGSGMSSS